MSKKYDQFGENIKNNIEDIYINNLKYKLYKSDKSIIIIDDYYENIEYYNKIDKEREQKIKEKEREQKKETNDINISYTDTENSNSPEKKNINKKNMKRLGMVALSTAVIVGSAMLNNNIN